MPLELDSSVTCDQALDIPFEEFRLAAARHGYCKRALDLILAVALLVFTSPIALLAMLLVRLTSPGPIIYSQVRLGLDGQPYRIYKIRSMRHDCERESGPVWSSGSDPRVTPIGRFLRITHVDELPQLWNVLRGEMSLVGPRPERPEIAAQIHKVYPSFKARLLIRPGVTGLAQVQLPPDSNLESVRSKLICDLHYLRHHTLWLDLRIIVSTALGVCGIPFAVSHHILRIPEYSNVEAHYIGLLSQEPAFSSPHEDTGQLGLALQPVIPHPQIKVPSYLSQ